MQPTNGLESRGIHMETLQHRRIVWMVVSVVPEFADKYHMGLSRAKRMESFADTQANSVWAQSDLSAGASHSPHATGCFPGDSMGLCYATDLTAKFPRSPRLPLNPSSHEKTGDCRAAG